MRDSNHRSTSILNEWFDKQASKNYINFHYRK